MGGPGQRLVYWGLPVLVVATAAPLVRLEHVRCAGAGHDAWSAALGEACVSEAASGRCEAAPQSLVSWLRRLFTATTAAEFLQARQRVRGAVKDLLQQQQQRRVVLLNVPGRGGGGGAAARRLQGMGWANRSLDANGGGGGAGRALVATAIRPSSRLRPTTSGSFDTFMSYPFATKPGLTEVRAGEGPCWFGLVPRCARALGGWVGGR